jgi:hypothetical protein
MQALVGTSSLALHHHHHYLFFCSRVPPGSSLCCIMLYRQNNMHPVHYSIQSTPCISYSVILQTHSLIQSTFIISITHSEHVVLLFRASFVEIVSLCCTMFTPPLPPTLPRTSRIYIHTSCTLTRFHLLPPQYPPAPHPQLTPLKLRCAVCVKMSQEPHSSKFS